MKSLTAKQREEAFPVHIELGKDGGDMAMPVPADAVGKKGKSKKYFPTVYIDAIPGLEKLPKEGCMLVEFKRKELRIGEDSAGVTLELHTICLMSEEAEEDDAYDLESAMRRQGPKEKDE